MQWIHQVDCKACNTKKLLKLGEVAQHHLLNFSKGTGENKHFQTIVGSIIFNYFL